MQLANHRPALHYSHFSKRSLWVLKIQNKHDGFHTNTLLLMKQSCPSFKSCGRTTNVSHKCSPTARHASSLSYYGSTKKLGVTGTYIALGSNIGDRIGYIEAACRELSRAGLKVLRTSALYETKPMYVEDQDSFLNAVCQVSILSLSSVLLELLLLIGISGQCGYL